MDKANKVIIDSTKLAHNTRALKQSLSAQCRLMAVVQDDAYAHGAIACAKIALNNGVDWLAVSCVEEGVELRESGIAAPILVLGLTSSSSVDEVIRWNLRCSVFEPELILELESAAKQKKSRVKVHLEIDSGLHRYGIRSEADLHNLFMVWKRCPNVILESVFTQFANADSSDKSYLFEQQKNFLHLLPHIKSFAGDNLLLHAGNTATALDIPACHFDMVRCGIGLYGYYPSEYVNHDVTLYPVLQWESRVSHILPLKEGETLGYSSSYKADADRLVAVLPIGYSDGYRRAFEGQAEVLIHGQRAPVIGQICMDQCMVDITEITGSVAVGDEVVLLGSQGSECIDATEIASWINGSHYEVLLGIHPRIPREYL